jgi:hypothetical protein
MYVEGLSAWISRINILVIDLNKKQV